MTGKGREKPLSVVPASGRPESDSPIPKTCASLTRDGRPCGSFPMAGDPHCFSHSENISDAERRQAWRLGGLTSTAAPHEADVPAVSLKSRAEVAEARERVYALTVSRVLSSAVASTLLTALRDADAQRDRAEALAIERRGRPHRGVPPIRINLTFGATQRPALPITVLPA